MRLLLTVLLALGCSRGAPAPPPSEAPAAAPTGSPVSLAPPSTRRIVAVGDLHGDLDATRRALRLGGLIGEDDAWAGGDTIFVQTGDVLDRGDGEDEIYTLLWKLQAEAPQQGGRVVLLNGNHEIMNAQGDVRYVTPDGFQDFAPEGADPASAQAARKAAFAPGGPWARKIAPQPMAVVVEGVAFAHGGILPAHARYGLDQMNAETRAWLEGRRPALPAPMAAADAPIWTRLYSTDTTPAGCATLSEALALLGARRMVVGHTVQPGGVTAACDGKIWRIDVGLAAHYGGPSQALEIVGERVTVLK